MHRADERERTVSERKGSSRWRNRGTEAHTGMPRKRHKAEINPRTCVGLAPLKQRSQVEMRARARARIPSSLIYADAFLAYLCSLKDEERREKEQRSVVCVNGMS